MAKKKRKLTPSQIRKRERITKIRRAAKYREKRYGVYYGKEFYEKLKTMTKKQHEDIMSINPKTGKPSYTGLEKYQKEVQPDDIGKHISDIIFAVFGQLSLPAPTHKIDKYGKLRPRRPVDIRATEIESAFLLRLLRSVSDEIGYAELGYRLEEKSERVLELVDIVRYDYEDKIRQASIELSEIIKGGPLSHEERQELADEEVEGWDVY